MASQDEENTAAGGTVVRPRPRTPLRLGGALTVVLLLFASALALTQVSLRKLANAEAEVARLDHAKHTGHLASAHVRESYIHQAHTIIEGDQSHVGHYLEVADTTHGWLDRLRAQTTEDGDIRRVAEMTRLAELNHHEFQAVLLPAIDSGDIEAIRELHKTLEERVAEVGAINDELNRSLEARAEEARHQAVEIRKSAQMATGACFVVALVLSAYLGVYLIRTILSPLQSLRQGAERVAAGDLAHRINLAGDDEFAELADTFDRMTSQLQRHQEELVRSHRLASVGRMAAGVAHEINNPLGVIVGYVRLLQRELGKREELKIIDDELQQCQRIVQGLLDLTRPNRLELRELDLGELVTDTVERLREADTRREARTEVTAPAEPLLVRTDERRFRQVLTNILTNAREAAPDGGQVSVVTSRDGDGVRVVVADTGPGIPPEVREHIFEPFYTTKATGTGLGLAVSQAIVHALGGHIELDTELEAGTAVSVYLPATVPPDEARGGTP